MKVKGKPMSKLVQYAVILGVVGFISFLFPNNTRFKYDFEHGQTWRHEDLVSPFSFAIQKPEAAIQAEMAELNIVTPFYDLNPDRARQRKNIFQKAFDQQLATVKADNQFQDVQRRPERYLEYGRRFIDRIYIHGVIDAQHELAQVPSDKVITLINGNTTSRRTAQMLLTPEKIDDWITDSLFNSGLSEAEFLIPLLSNDYATNVEFNAALTEKLREAQLADISKTYGMVRKGEIIVVSNSVVTDSIYQKLISFRDHYQHEILDNRAYLVVFLGYLMLTFLILGAFVSYLRYHAPTVYKYFKPFCFAMMWLVVYSYLVYIVRVNATLSPYIIPFCIVPIVINNFYDERLALFTHVTVVLMTSFLSDLGYAFIFLQLIAGIVAVLSNIIVRDWSRFFVSMLFIFLAYSTAYLGLSLIQEGNVFEIDFSIYTWIFLNVFLTLLAYPLIPLLERVFGFTSSLTLSELSDMNKPLLKELSIKSPGTLQHSLQVANLSEAAARKIGADYLLVKVAALYHDIGKISEPQYFIENQKGYNPHDQLTPLESAQKIIAHVTIGEELARKNKLPEVIIDFILTHHGTTRVEFFYHKHLEQKPNGQEDEAAFRYPGPRPRSREEAILMMADSIEAAAKSLKEPTQENISELVDKIIAGKITKGQLKRSQLNFRELELCKKEFQKLLLSIYHVRIEYPEGEKG